MILSMLEFQHREYVRLRITTISDLLRKSTRRESTSYASVKDLAVSPELRKCVNISFYGPTLIN